MPPVRESENEVLMDVSIHTTAPAAVEPWPKDGLESVDRCPVCGNPTRKLLHKNLDDRVFFCAPGTWALYRCTVCDSGYLDPRPTPETVGLAYSRYFTHATSTQRAFADLSTARRLRRALGNGYRNARFGISLKPSNSLGVWLMRYLPWQRAMLDAEARYLPQAQPGAMLLDVGCGNGEFLALAAEMGWKVEGVDFDAKAVEVASERGFVAHHGGIEALEGRTEYYDVITLSHVIEHVHEPLSLLTACFRLLKPGGHLWLETPNLESAGYAHYGRHWRGLEPPRHLVLFTWASLNSALAQAGFIRVSATPWRPLARNLYSASEAIRQGKDPCRETNNSLCVRWHAWRADRKTRRDLTHREFITIFAHKSR